MIGNKWRKHTTQAGSGLSETTPSDTLNNSTGIRGMEKWATTRLSLTIEEWLHRFPCENYWLWKRCGKMMESDFLCWDFTFLRASFENFFSARTISEPSRQLYRQQFIKKQEGNINESANCYLKCLSLNGFLEYFWNIFRYGKFFSCSRCWTALMTRCSFANKISESFHVNEREYHYENITIANSS